MKRRGFWEEISNARQANSHLSSKVLSSPDRGASIGPHCLQLLAAEEDAPSEFPHARPFHLQQRKPEGQQFPKCGSVLRVGDRRLVRDGRQKDLSVPRIKHFRQSLPARASCVLFRIRLPVATRLLATASQRKGPVHIRTGPSLPGL